MTPKRQIAGITLACVAIYITMRTLPVEKCQFLHYGDYVNSEGVIEGCGYEETEFFVMSKIRFPILAELTPLAKPVVNQPAQFELALVTTTGKPINWEEIAISHTERIHAMVIDPSLEDYHHVHPQPAGPPGHYLLDFTPGRTGHYSVYLDFIPLASSQRTLLSTGFEVEGMAESPKAANRRVFQNESFRFSLDSDSSDLVAGQTLIFTLKVESLKDSPILFTPVMDSFAHVVAFDGAGTGFAHLHPSNPLVEDQDPAHPDLQFSVKFDKPGYYRVWAQMIVNGEHSFIPFDLVIGEA